MRGGRLIEGRQGIEWGCREGGPYLPASSGVTLSMVSRQEGTPLVTLAHTLQQKFRSYGTVKWLSGKIGVFASV